MADVSGKHRKSFSVRFKRQAVRAVEDMMKSGLSIRQAMDRLQIHHWYYARWKKVVTRADDIQKDKHTHLTSAETSKNFIRVVKVP